MTNVIKSNAAKQHRASRRGRLTRDAEFERDSRQASRTSRWYEGQLAEPGSPMRVAFVWRKHSSVRPSDVSATVASRIHLVVPSSRHLRLGCGLEGPCSRLGTHGFTARVPHCQSARLRLRVALRRQRTGSRRRFGPSFPRRPGPPSRADGPPGPAKKEGADGAEHARALQERRPAHRHERLRASTACTHGRVNVLWRLGAYVCSCSACAHKDRVSWGAREHRSVRACGREPAFPGAVCLQASALSLGSAPLADFSQGRAPIRQRALSPHG